MMKSRWWKFAGAVSLVSSLAVFSGCNSEGSAPGAAPSEDVEKAPQAEGASKGEKGEKGEGRREGPRGKRGGKHAFAHGPAGLLGAALHELDLSDAQKTTIKGALEGLHDDGFERPKAPEVFTALAAGVRAGSIDKAAIEAKVAKSGDAMEEHKAKMASALTTLHTTLTKEQRRALVDAMTAKMEERGEKGPRGPMGEGKGRRGGDDDGEGWGGPKGERGGRGEHGMKGGPLGHMLRDLDLTEEQRAQIDKALEASRPDEADMEEKKEAFEAKRAEMKAQLESFASDSFDAKAFLARGDAKHGPKAHFDHMISALSAVVPILTEAQRNTLADQLEKGPMGKPGRGFGKPGRGEKGEAETR